MFGELHHVVKIDGAIGVKVPRRDDARVETFLADQGFFSGKDGDDNDDWLVPAGVGAGQSFDVLLDPYLDQDNRLLTDSGIWACPSDDIERNPATVPNPPHPPRSYVISFYLSIDSRYNSQSVKLSDIPTDMVIFGEYWSKENGCRTEYGAANFFTGIFWVGLEAPHYGRYHLEKYSNFLIADLSVQSFSLEKMNDMPWMAGNKFYWEQ